MNAAAADVAVHGDERRLDPQAVEQAAEPVAASQRWAKVYMAEARLWTTTIGAASVPVLVALRSWDYRQDGRCWPSHESIAARSGLSVTQVRVHLRKARAAGLVDWEPRHTGKAGRPANVYRLPDPTKGFTRVPAQKVSAGSRRLKQRVPAEISQGIKAGSRCRIRKQENPHKASGGGAPLQTQRTAEEEAAEIVRFHRELVGRDTGGGPAVRRHVEDLLAEGATPAALRLAVVGAAMDPFVLGGNNNRTDHMLNLAFVLSRPDPERPSRPSYVQRAEQARGWSGGLPDAVTKYWGRRWHEEVFERFRRERDAARAAEQTAPVEPPVEPPVPAGHATGYRALFASKPEPGCDEGGELLPEDWP